MIFYRNPIYQLEKKAWKNLQVTYSVKLLKIMLNWHSTPTLNYKVFQ